MTNNNRLGGSPINEGAVMEFKSGLFTIAFKKSRLLGLGIHGLITKNVRVEFLGSLIGVFVMMSSVAMG